MNGGFIVTAERKADEQKRKGGPAAFYDTFWWGVRQDIRTRLTLRFETSLGTLPTSLDSGVCGRARAAGLSIGIDSTLFRYP